MEKMFSGCGFVFTRWRYCRQRSHLAGTAKIASQNIRVVLKPMNTRWAAECLFLKVPVGIPSVSVLYNARWRILVRATPLSIRQIIKALCEIRFHREKLHSKYSRNTNERCRSMILQCGWRLVVLGKVSYAPKCLFVLKLNRKGCSGCALLPTQQCGFIKTDSFGP